MFPSRLTIAGLVLAIAAPAAHAGSSIFTGAVKAEVGQELLCWAINTSPTKTMTHVKVTFRGIDGLQDGSGSCAAVGPRETCPVDIEITSGSSTLPRYCEFTSDQGAKNLRATLSNSTTGASSDAR